MAGNTKGERVFEAYLADIGATWEYEPEIGGRCPDYLVHSPAGDVLCEIEDFGQGDIDRKVQAHLKRKGVWAGAVYPYARIREKLDAASDQLREFKGRYPCVVVLHNPGVMVDLGTEIVAAAMFGNLAFVIAVDPTGQRPPVERGTQFTPRKAKLRRCQNTTISAVAVLEYFRPHAHLLDEALARRSTKRHPPAWPTREEVEEALDIVARVRGQHPEIDREVPRLRVVHNIYAGMPLAAEAFPGLYDEHWGLDPQTRRFKRFK
jgi:hypothetical protein